MKTAVDDEEAVLLNQWYAVAWADDVDRALLQRWVAGQPLVLYRTQEGSPIALDDRCVHRQYPLSRGRLVGDDLECGYHGFKYDCSGACVYIPAQRQIPTRARVRSYPVVQRHQMLWVWLGDAELVDESLLPSYYWLDHPDWTVVRGTLHLDARCRLLNENLLDLSHEAFLHSGSIGNQELAETPIETEIDGHVVRVSRLVSNAPTPPLYVHLLSLDEPILVDRWQIEEFTPPGAHVIHGGVVRTGQDRDTEGFHHKVIHIGTPETSTTTHYFWAFCRSFAREESISQLLRDRVPGVLAEDVNALEAQEVMIATDQRLDVFECSAKIDSGLLKARRLVENLREMENSVQASDR